MLPITVINEVACGGRVAFIGFDTSQTLTPADGQRGHCEPKIQHKVSGPAQRVFSGSFSDFFAGSCNACGGRPDRTSEPGGCPDPRADSHQAYSFPEVLGAVI
ncbi:hypothetical protein GCM10009789_75950 [Kribbella sancticallisti]|uniref:Uncharacterized protein n=1 Tax=Kribbella sancticallisti TaxID=460087 RepID=A0ABP4QGZ9_9ACTN